jgi:predicted RNA binding protein YcfA (HicA-like mRNA interferase family)
MKLPRDLDAAQLVKLLARVGYRVVRQSGSHIRLHCDEPAHSITIPNHRPLRVGTLAAILSDIADKRSVDRDELMRMLER